jgi:(1->4)-alpha-D-glucan 1-alpha-D-glucosylmutase
MFLEKKMNLSKRDEYIKDVFEEGKNLVSTYRFQLNKDFTLKDAKGQLPYIKELGISTVYLSPITKATPGSIHGYDVVDFAEINPEIGGLKAFYEFAGFAHELGLTLLVDIVPNHMTIPAKTYLNKYFFDVLYRGVGSKYASLFDIFFDEANGKIVLPFLDEELNDVLEKGKIGLDELPETVELTETKNSPKKVAVIKYKD